MPGYSSFTRWKYVAACISKASKAEPRVWCSLVLFQQHGFSGTKVSITWNYVTCFAFEGVYFSTPDLKKKKKIFQWLCSAPKELAYHCEPHMVARYKSKTMWNAFGSDPLICQGGSFKNIREGKMHCIILDVMLNSVNTDHPYMCFLKLGTEIERKKKKWICQCW